MSSRRVTNPSGSSNALRADVLRVLGVVKVATADQIQRLAAPHLSYRHTGKPTDAARKEARTRPHRAAATDLKRHGLVVEAGHSRAGEKLWSLTPAGLEAAAAELGRPMQEMGGTARGAGRSGAAHALSVTETVWAISRPTPHPELLADEPAAAAAAGAAPAGIGAIESWATEVPLPATGTWATAGRGGAQADAVLTAPEHEVPLLFVEVDNCHMDAARIATKLDKYARFFRRTVKDVDGQERPMWTTRWPAASHDRYRSPLPPLLVVYHPIGPRDPETSSRQVADRTRPHWQGEWRGDHHRYGGKIPLLFTTIGMLRHHGPTGPAFRRAGREKLQNLHDAIGNARQDAAEVRDRAQAQERARQYQREQEAAREARRPICAGCGEKLTDARWDRAEKRDARWDEYRNRCEPCAKAAAARDRAEREAAQAAQEAEQRAAEEAEQRRSRGLLRRLRS